MSSQNDIWYKSSIANKNICAHARGKTYLILYILIQNKIILLNIYIIINGGNSFVFELYLSRSFGGKFGGKNG